MLQAKGVCVHMDYTDALLRLPGLLQHVLPHASRMFAAGNLQAMEQDRWSALDTGRTGSTGILQAQLVNHSAVNLSTEHSCSTVSVGPWQCRSGHHWNSTQKLIFLPRAQFSGSASPC